MPEDLIRSEPVAVVVRVSLKLEGKGRSGSIPRAELINLFVNRVSVFVHTNLVSLETIMLEIIDSFSPCDGKDHMPELEA